MNRTTRATWRRLDAIGRATAACVAMTGAAVAEPSPADKVNAEALFDEAKKLVESGKFAEACPKFAESQKLDPGIGTLLYLGDCYERNGQPATAWATFREAAAAAKERGQSDREKIARDRASAIEPKLPRLSVVVPPASVCDGLEIRRDGASLGRPLWGSALPVDPGAHRVEASAPGRTTWTTSIQVGAGPASVGVTVPALAPAGAAIPAATAAKPTTAATSAEPVVPPPAPGAEPARGANGQRTLALVAGGVGVVGVAVGTVFGFSARSKWQDSRSHCREGNLCDAAGVTLVDDASKAATLSTVAFAVGAAGIAGGAVLWFTAPPAGEGRRAVRAAPAVGASGGGIVVGGDF